jgi:8-oxo-dGTP diphosphatase
MSPIRTPRDRELHPIVSVDIALFSIVDEALKVLLVRRANEPARGGWALPGGVIDPGHDASLEEAARRVLRDKTGLDDVPYLAQFATWGGPDRDPRGWSVSVLHHALLPLDQVPAIPGRKTEAIAWRDAAAPGRGLAFDHAEHVAEALERLRDKVDGRALPLHLMPERFTLTDLQQTVERILGRPLEKSAFRRRIRDDPSLEPIDGEFRGGQQRPAQLYRAAAGFAFEKVRR